ncbi:transporter substrate-binding domain-containing protein [Siculibacillus lacustris]|uniref:Transporter substrate-binding domain-containing protein n=1 Tax=Siculibacillus lacustris TaxID=1549641 RepID=A0A4Q9VZU9_9HYPH|nr:transporter substrate-binding domain-containing protein [Siculibacillus lacustris]TBW41044.1 transporter substrate-binding domain-containing protein [Siculibacillus lacustris]
MNRRVLINWSLALGVSLGLSTLAPKVASADVLDAVKKAGVLKVGTETEFAPFDFIDKGKHVGLNVDLFDEIGKELGVKIEWIALPWDGVLPGLESGKFDIVAGPATITKKRLERYKFSPPIAEATVAILKKKGDASITKPEDIAGKATGAGKATVQLSLLQDLVKKLPKQGEVKEYVGFNEAYADLAAGRIAAVANSLPNIAFVAQTSGAFEVVLPTFGPKTYFGFPENADAEHVKLNEAVAVAMGKIKADGRMGKIQKKWFGVEFDTPAEVKEPSL